MESNHDRAKRIIKREATRQRGLIKQMQNREPQPRDWTPQQVKSLRIAMRKQQLEVLEELHGLFD